MRVILLYDRVKNRESADAASVLEKLNIAYDLFPVDIEKDRDVADIDIQRLKDATHLIIVFERALDTNPFFAYVLGFFCGRREKESLYIYNPENDNIPGNILIYHHGETAKKMEAYISASKKQWEKNEEIRKARAELKEMGLPYIEETFASCVEEGNIRAIQLFIKTGMSVNLKNKKGVSMLALAVRRGHRILLPLFLKAKADVNAVSDDRGNTPLMDAAAEGNADFVSDLIKAGADLDIKSKNGQTALILAVGQGSKDAALILIRAGADTEIKDALGMSAGKYAELFRHTEIIDAINKAGNKTG